MKKIFIFTLIILSYSIFSQNYNNYLHNSNTGSFDKSGKKVGDWKEYEMKGESKIIGIGKYKNGFRINKWKFYWSNGKLAEIGKYNKKGIRKGKWKFYSELGLLKAISQYNKSKWREFYNNGHLESVGQIRNEREIGKWEYYYENGKLKSFGHYDEYGDKTGEWKYYNQNGKLIKKQQY